VIAITNIRVHTKWFTCVVGNTLSKWNHRKITHRHDMVIDVFRLCTFGW